ncbi:BTAD domain-containing putative transcriptional regulator [Actinoplanes sp. NPDC051346]|uniref:BTAD domain-containing putative transcriptional regulator n=1 Tax=Actinoplanes sp. NPDC051346 TaxID=3155048 RepID=UPI0034355879
MLADHGGEIRLCRLRAGLTQEQLAQRAGISVRAVRDIEQGRVRSPRAESLRRIAEALGLPGWETPTAEQPRVTPAEPALRIDILGPLSIRFGAEPVALGSGRQRMLLGLLALHPGGIVSRREIVDVLWGHNPPDSCHNLVHTHVARLRRVLARADGDVTTIAHVGGGYRLRIDPEQLDLTRSIALIEHAEGGAGGDLATLERLAEALALWRGPVLADLAPALAQHPTAAALNRRRIATAVSYAGLAADLGFPDRAVRELHAVAGHEPLHEQLHGRLMLALAACGQQAQALTLYQRLRDRLADQLGVEPGVELREAHLRILRQDLPGATPRAGGPSLVIGGEAAVLRGMPAPAPRVLEHRPPAQLPANVAYFTGRAGQLDLLDAMLAEADVTSGPIIIVTGMAGVGKTALAVHWAHRARRRFPDGQLYINLRGYSTSSPVRAGEALAGFLRALGVPAEQVPVDPEQAAALFRTMLDGRRMLVVLDNAATAEQVRPLLPGTPGCLAMITSRDRLSGLIAVDGARRIDLDVLTEVEASTLLTRIIPTDRVAKESTEIAELAEVCARLPLALRIAAANLIDHPGRPIRSHTARLTAGNQLTGLRVEGDDQSAVRAEFDLSYAALTPSTRRLFRLLGPAPWADLTVPAAAALVGIDETTAAGGLDRLAAAHLLQQLGTARYTFHDLLRIYAVERATVEDLPAELHAATRRLYLWCQARTAAAAAAIYPHMVRLPPTDDVPASTPFSSATEALAWLEAEHTNLVRVVAHAADHGADPAAWRISDALRGYYHFRPDSDGYAAATTALRAAQLAGDHAGEAAGRLGLASLHLRRSEYEAALAHGTEMIDAAVRARWPEGEAAGYGTCGLVHLKAGRLAEGARMTRRAANIQQRLDTPVCLSTSLCNLGVIYREMGRLREADAVLTHGLALTRSTGMRMSSGIILTNLGEIQHALGRHELARRSLHEALEISRQSNHRPTEMESFRRLAALHVHDGDLDKAAELTTLALALAEQVHDSAQQAAARNMRGTIHLRQGDDDAAARQHRHALDLARAAGNRRDEAISLIGLAEAQCRHDPAQALTLAGQARAIARTVGYRVWEGHALVATAEALRGTDPEAAARTAGEALAIHRETGHQFGRIRALRLLAEVGGAAGAGPALGRDTAERPANLRRPRAGVRPPISP